MGLCSKYVAFMYLWSWNSPTQVHFLLQYESKCSANPNLIHPHPHTSLPASIPNTIHHSCLTVCLPHSQGLEPLLINFVLIKRLWISWFPRFRFCGRCRNLEFTITITSAYIPIIRHSFCSCGVSRLPLGTVGLKTNSEINYSDSSHKLHGIWLE